MKIQKGFTLVELLIVVAIVALIAAIAVPGLLRSRMAANESSAIASLRAIVSAETAYSSGCGQNRYATALATLGLVGPGGAQPFLAPELAAAAPEKSGYRFGAAAGAGAVASGPDCNGTATATGYYVSAVPVAFGTSGMRAFAVNTAGTIWQAPSAAAPAEPFGAPSTPIQ